MSKPCYVQIFRPYICDARPAVGGRFRHLIATCYLLLANVAMCRHSGLTSAFCAMRLGVNLDTHLIFITCYFYLSNFQTKPMSKSSDVQTFRPYVGALCYAVGGKSKYLLDIFTTSYFYSSPSQTTPMSKPSGVQTFTFYTCDLCHAVGGKFRYMIATCYLL